MLKDVSASLTKRKVASLKKEDAKKYGSLPEEGLEVVIQYDFPEDTASAAEAFGEKICATLIEGHARFTMQTRMRNKLAAGQDADEIQAAFFDVAKGEYNWIPSEASIRKSSVEKEKDRLGKLDPETREREKQALLDMLAAME